MWLASAGLPRNRTRSALSDMHARPTPDAMVVGNIDPVVE